MDLPPPSVAIACSGLGHVRRGYETFTRALFERLRGVVPVTLFKGAGAADEGEEPLACVRRTAPTGRALRVVLSERKVYALEARSFAWSLWRALRRRPHDVVYVPDYHAATMLLGLRARFGAARPFTVLLHNGAPIGPKKLVGLDLVQQLARPYLDEALEAGLTNCRLVPLPVDTERFAPGDRAAARRALDLPDEAPVVLCAAAHVEFKRIDLAIEAVAAVPPGAGPPPLLVIAGHEGPLTGALRALAARRLGDRCRFLTLEPERMPEVHRAADVFVLPSRKEGFGLVVVEAMASGVPVVTHDDPVRRAVVGDAGVLVPCEREGALRDALARLLSSPDERARLGAAGRARADGELSWRALLPSYLRLFEEARALAGREVPS